MSGTEVRAEVVLCPDEQLRAEEPQRSWPRLAGAEVEITKRGTPTVADGTGADGQVAFRGLQAGIYNLTVTPGAELHRWRPDPNPARVDTRKPKALQKIKLIPPAGERLLALRLCGAGSGGKLIPLKGAQVDVTGVGRLDARSDGHVYALAPHPPLGRRAVVVTFHDAHVNGMDFEPPDETVTFELPEPDDKQVEVPVFVYTPKAAAARPLRGIFIKPTIKSPPGKSVPLAGATVSVELRSGTSRPAPQTKSLKKDEELVSFPNLDPGVYLITVHPPATFDGWQINAKAESIGPRYLNATEHFERDVEFKFEPEKFTSILQTPGGRPLDRDAVFEIYGPEGSDTTTARDGKFSADVPSNPPLRIRLAPGQPPPTIAGIPLEMVTPDQEIEPPPGQTVVILQYEHSISGRAVDESGNPMPEAVIVLYDGNHEVARAVADENGLFIAGLKAPGSYSIAIQTEGGAPVRQRLVSVNPPENIGDLVYRPWRAPGDGGSKRDRDRDGDGSGAGQVPREAFTDLAAYPVLTEEVSTTGVPAPAAGGGGGGGAAYGQVVDQAMRDVLGWRPGGDLAGFQAALTGAFKLREVEGHTEWSWQQRGYAVQADMGALTGAQASIYARAKAALDQIQPLLAGLVTLNPARYEPQDLESIRSVVGTELQELVSELAVEGGPRLQRVDELFTLLLGKGRKSRGMNPDLVQGQLGTLRDRFALTVDEVQTVDEERVVTNFRIIVEQVLALHASWNFDRQLLSAMSPKASFGTVLIWLSRGLEAVCESVGDLLFALDSVFVDAAQRQVIELRFEGVSVRDVPEVPFRGNPPQTMPPHLIRDAASMFLSDLLDWVLRASRDEGPRIIQDAGKDGVFAFRPVLNTLRELVRAARQIALERGSRNAMPAGMRTPRVNRAIQVLADQLDEAANLASLIQVEDPPTIAFVSILDPSSGLPVRPAGLGLLPAIEVMLTGGNFRGPAKAFLSTEDNEDIDPLEAKATIYNPSSASAIFPNPATRAEYQGTTWQVSFINADETHSNQIEALQVPR